MENTGALLEEIRGTNEVSGEGRRSPICASTERSGNKKKIEMDVRQRPRLDLGFERNKNISILAICCYSDIP